MSDLCDPADVAAFLTPAQLHVVSRCSEFEDWTARPNGFTRHWADLVAGRSHCSFKSIGALIRLGVIYRDSDGLCGLTELGLSVQFHARMAEK